MGDDTSDKSKKNKLSKSLKYAKHAWSPTSLGMVKNIRELNKHGVDGVEQRKSDDKDFRHADVRTKTAAINEKIESTGELSRPEKRQLKSNGRFDKTRGKQLDALKKHLDSGEDVVTAVAGTYETTFMKNDTLRTGILAATNHRLLFFGKKLGGYNMETFPYKTISSMEISKGMMGHTITFFASNNKVSVKWIHDYTVMDFLSEVKQRMGGDTQVQARPTAQPAEQSNSLDDLKKLAELKDAGIITADEFAAKKKQILGL